MVQQMFYGAPTKHIDGMVRCRIPWPAAHIQIDIYVSIYLSVSFAFEIRWTHDKTCHGGDFRPPPPANLITPFVIEVEYELRLLSGEGVPMSFKGIGSVDRLLYSAALRHFGSLENALEEAGLGRSDYEMSTWTDESVDADIQRLIDEKQHLSMVSVNKKYPSLVKAVRYRYGSWYDALPRFGVDPSKVRVRTHRTTDELLDELRSIYESGKPVHCSAMQKSHLRLRSALIKRFNGYDNALRAAGLDPAEYRLK